MDNRKSKEDYKQKIFLAKVFQTLLMAYRL